jgi:hypothetical protein
MEAYETRILQGNGQPIILSEVQPDDAAAISSARKAAHGRTFEVWRGLDRIFGPEPISAESSAA